jgi:hypothetical protein
MVNVQQNLILFCCELVFQKLKMDQMANHAQTEKNIYLSITERGQPWKGEIKNFS